MDKQKEEFEIEIKSWYPLAETIAKERCVSICDLYPIEWSLWQQAQKTAIPECKWTPCYDGSLFNTNCGHTFELSNSDSLEDNNMNYCCFCGGVIEAQEQNDE